MDKIVLMQAKFKVVPTAKRMGRTLMAMCIRTILVRRVFKAKLPMLIYIRINLGLHPNTTLLILLWIELHLTPVTSPALEFMMKPATLQDKKNRDHKISREVINQLSSRLSLLVLKTVN